jgi:uncharacterized protein YceK
MASKYIQLASISFAAMLLTGCGSENSSEDSGESTGGNYISCVLEYNDAVRAGILDATQSEIMEDCRNQYSP